MSLYIDSVPNEDSSEQPATTTTATATLSESLRSSPTSQSFQQASSSSLSSSTSDMNVNRNESFINTAAKLLERAKQQHQMQQLGQQQLSQQEEAKVYGGQKPLANQQSKSSATSGVVNSVISIK
jgi:hypothetical protein